MSHNLANKCHTDFHKQVLDCWNSLYCKKSTTPGEVLNEFVLNNKFLVSEGKPFQLQQFKISDKRLNDLVIGEIVHENGNFYSLSHINESYGIKLDKLSYNKMLASIPKEWKTMIIHGKQLDHKRTLQFCSKKSTQKLQKLTRPHFIV